MPNTARHTISRSSLVFHLLLSPNQNIEISYCPLDSELSLEAKIYLKELGLRDNQKYASVDWAKAVGEIQWDDEECLDHVNQLYHPPVFEKNPHWDLSNLLTGISKIRGKVLIEVMNEVISNRSDSPWNRALSQAIQCLKKLNSNQRTPCHDKSLILYQNLVENQTAKVYRLNIRAFSEHSIDALHLLTTWTDTALSGDHRPTIKLHEAHAPRFDEHVSTFAKRQPAPPHPWSETQRAIGQLTFNEAIRPAKEDFLSRYGDGSLSTFQPELSDTFKQVLASHDNPPVSLPRSQQSKASGTGLSKQPPSQLDQTSNSSGSLLSTLLNKSAPPAAIVADFRPLSSHFPLAIAEQFIAPCIELANHYHNLKQAEANKPFSRVYTLESLVQAHGHQINDDEHIVGTDSTGQPVFSDFRVSPHRFVAGEVGAGKTNFLKVLLYQQLWHNPNRLVWLADFKEGLDFRVVSKIFPNVQLITNYAEFDQLLKDFWSQSEERIAYKQQDIEDELEHLRSLTPEERKHYQEEKDHKRGEASWGRNLLIIDEMAQLNHLYNDRDQKEIAKSVQASLDKVVRLGRAFKANVIFCTQSKEEGIIDSNLLNNVGDRLIFRVSADTVSMRFLGSDKASKLSPRHKGRGIYRGPDYAGDAEDLKEVATPRFPDDDLVTEFNFWAQLKNRSLSP